MMKYYCLLLLFVLSACGTAPSATPIALQSTAPAPTPIDLKTLKLEPLLIAAGDLPAGIAAGQVFSEPPPAYISMNVPPADNIVFQRFVRGDQPAGYVVVSLYSDTKVSTTTSTALTNDLTLGSKKDGLVTAKPIQELGDRSLYAEVVGPSIVFVRCHAVVSVLLVGNNVGKLEAAAYAKRLDSRLQPLVCS